MLSVMLILMWLWTYIVRMQQMQIIGDAEYAVCVEVRILCTV